MAAAPRSPDHPLSFPPAQREADEALERAKTEVHSAIDSHKVRAGVGSGCRGHSVLPLARLTARLTARLNARLDCLGLQDTGLAPDQAAKMVERLLDAHAEHASKGLELELSETQVRCQPFFFFSKARGSLCTSPHPPPPPQRAARRTNQS